MRHRILIVAAAVATCATVLPVHAAEDTEPARTKWQRPVNWSEIVADDAKLDVYRCPKPDELAIVFSFGYAGDGMPKEIGKYEQMVVKAKQSGFNVIHGTYTPERLEVIRKLLSLMDYEDKNPKVATHPDAKIVGDSRDFLNHAE